VAAYRWTGRTTNGQILSGTLEAASKEHVLRSLREQQIVVMSVTDGRPARAIGARRFYAWSSASPCSLAATSC
jgi:type II secretory pathway component PulF